ncbi:neuroligin-4, Y-linked-like isoform X1 [Amphibalanus amphitrite]|uniref:neuroligin-4, Y-linked-like isoform X1 n=1 Tax=Amphibalanus amphitrite TaxID=1232801 RepID=UPI001C924EFD|nr:neuroligin-4, Y-linked-like isoform X1 [Amphibalanus amphitrite]
MVRVAVVPRVTPLVLALVSGAVASRLVTTQYGQLQGFLRSFQRYQVSGAPALLPVNVFLGVPYARPPLGSNRFSPTRTLAPWKGTGVRSATQLAPVCPQKLPAEDREEALRNMPREAFERTQRLRAQLKNQSEDCLYLNVYAPAHRGADLYPVMVYIHGDSYLWSSGNLYDGGVLASFGEVVVITINYRLGLFGFLNPSVGPTQQVTNNGLLDQIAALHWIQQNVEAFGGDPDKVTLFGHGSGAACISFLLNSPAAVTDLFHRAIVMSGSSLSSLAVVQDPAQYALRLGVQVGCVESEDSTTNSELLVDCLREQSVERLLEADVGGYQFLPTFGPSVDRVVVPATVRRGARRNQGKVYSLMFGVAERDASNMLADDDLREGMTLDRRDRVLRSFVRNTHCYSNVEIFYSIINAYTEWGRARRGDKERRDETLAALTDAVFVAPVTADADLHAPLEASPKDADPTFFYVFNREKKGAPSDESVGGEHGAEIPFVFGWPLVQETTGAPQFTADDIALSQTVMTFWTSFAKTGDPNEPPGPPPGRSADPGGGRYRTTAWQRYDRTFRQYMEIGDNPRMRSHYRARQVAFWNELVPQLHEAGERSRRPELQFEDTGDAAHLYSGPVRPSCSQSPRVRIVTAPPATEPPATTAAPVVTTSASAPTSPAPVTTQSLHTISRSHERGAPSDDGWTYSTVLSVTVTIGCSLLVLNLLIFAGMYYQRKKYEESRKRFQSSAQPSTVSLDLGQGQAPGPGSVSARRKSVGSGSDCAACKSGGVHQHGSLESGRQTALPPPNGELNFAVPKPPPPPRGSTLTLPSSESQPLLLHHASAPPPRRPPPALDELRV